jgi:hypothetical protein
MLTDTRAISRKILTASANSCVNMIGDHLRLHDGIYTGNLQFGTTHTPKRVNVVAQNGY